MVRSDVGATVVGGAAIVLPGSVSGGYFPSAWNWLTLVFICVTGLGVLVSTRLSVAPVELVFFALLIALAGWTLASAAWGVPGSSGALEARRAAVYISGLAALTLWTKAGSVAMLLTGMLIGIDSLAVYALGERIVHPVSTTNPFEGHLLVGSIGYANALAIVVAIGVIISVGLAALSSRTPAAQLFRASACLLVVVLVLTGSRGGWLALLAGLLACAALAEGSARQRLLATLLVITPSTALACVLAPHARGPVLALVIAAAAVAAALIPPPAHLHRLTIAAAAASCAIAIAAGAVAAVSMSSSYRAGYWQVAARDAADHPLLGSGAGSFAHVWLQRRPVAISARDAHSLYLETLAELGPLGLLLVLALAATPIIFAVRNRNQPLVAVAGGGYAAFLVHAGIDWDWEMPVVVLSGLGCAVAVLASARVAPSLQILTDRARL